MPLTDRIIATIGSGVMAEAMRSRLAASANSPSELETAMATSGLVDASATTTSRFFVLGCGHRRT